MWLASVFRSGSSVVEVALVGRRALAAHFDAPFDPLAGFWWVVIVDAILFLFTSVVTPAPNPDYQPGPI
jgi:hypothetical protein